MPPVIYSQHARDQMAKRGITETDVEMALRHPIGSPLPGEPGTIWIKGHAPAGRILKVCVRLTDRDFVITAAWPGHRE